MRIAYVTPYPPRRCGIGIYASLLAAEVARREEIADLFVAAEEGAVAAHEGRLRILPSYRREAPYDDSLPELLAREQVALAHIQHAPDLLGEDLRLPRLCERLRARGIRTLVTLHTVYTKGQGHTEFYKALGRAADGLIVHSQAGMADVLCGLGLPKEKIHVIAHGTAFLPTLDPLESRRRLGLPEEGFAFLCFGFIHVAKNIHTPLAAFLRLAREEPEARLIIAGMPFGDHWYNHLYLGAMKARVRLAGLGGRVHFLDHYIDPEVVPALFSASQALLLPHWQKYGSASGVFHQAIGADKPAICARGPKFEEGLKTLADYPELVVDALNVGQWTKGMRCLVRDPRFYEQARILLGDYAKATAWPVVAGQHVALYRRLLAGSK